jgi:hypothetical protein
VVEKSNTTQPERTNGRRNRLIAVGAVVVVAGAIAAVLIAGGGSKTSIEANVTTTTLSGSVEAQVKSAVTGFARALADSDGQGVCALLSPDARQAFIGSMSAFARGSCPDLVKASLAQAPAGALSSLRSARVTDVVISGTDARATLVAGSTQLDVPVVEVGGRWLLATASGVLSG